jgi:hypothetical protein
MRFFLFVRLTTAVCIAAIAAGPAFPCKCSRGFHGKNSWELARLETEGSTAIFEGAPERFELEWGILNANVGEWIATEDWSSRPDKWPKMVVTFRVQRTYKGDVGPEAKIKTGLGGGDCGEIFEPGLTYLVFAGRLSAGDLAVSMCSPGGWIRGYNTATELRYLKKERASARDLAPIRRWDEKEYAAQEEERKRDSEEYGKRYATATGKICGTAAVEKTKDGNTGMVSFLFVGGFSPSAHPTASVNSDGLFCSGRLGPGKYYLYFTRDSKEGLTSAVYYPGVVEREKAKMVEVDAGQIQSGISFKVPAQEMYPVRGVLSIYDTSRVGAHVAYVTLVKSDGGLLQAQHVQRIDFKGSSALPKVKYFKFANVLPGRYTAYVSGLGRDWFTKKDEVRVTTHMRFISLELVHRK